MSAPRILKAALAFQGVSTVIAFIGVTFDPLTLALAVHLALAVLFGVLSLWWRPVRWLAVAANAVLVGLYSVGMTLYLFNLPDDNGIARVVGTVAFCVAIIVPGSAVSFILIRGQSKMSSTI